MSANARVAGVPSATYRFGDYAFDPGSRLLTHKGLDCHLSLKGQQLLELLLRARPRALSRKELYDALWPSTFVCETNLASIISEVRRVLGDDRHAPRYIRTLHGFGYSFCGEVLSSAAPKFVAAKLQCGHEIYLLHEGENLIGRAEDCRVVIPARTVSRHHAVIRIDNGSLSIADLDSTNGTYVQGKRIGRSPVAVTHLSRIAFGTLEASILFRRMSSTNALRLSSSGSRTL